jgi:hypothetical protein
MIFPLNVSVNVIIDFSTGYYRHDAIVPGTPPVKIPMVPSFEMIATQAWGPGIPMGKNKFSSSVVYRGFPIALDGHECGPLIPDMTPPQPANLNYAIMWPTSTRKMVLSSHSVEHDGQKVACAQMLLLPIPMMTCGDPIDAPVAVINLNMFNTEKVGVSLAEFLVALAVLAVGMIIDAAFASFSKDKSELTSSFSEHMMKELWKSWGTPLEAKDWAKWAVKVGAGILLSPLSTNEQGEFEMKAPAAKAELMGITAEIDLDKAGKEGEDVFSVEAAKPLEASWQAAQTAAEMNPMITPVAFL